MSYCITEEELREYIPKDVEEKLYNCISSAIQEHRTEYKSLNYRHSARTNANIVHDIIVDNVKRNFQNIKNTRYFTKRNCFQLVIGNDDIAGKISTIRFKKFDNNKIAHSNIPYRVISRFEQLSLLGPNINLNAGYLLQGLDVSIFVTRPHDQKSNEWDWELVVKPTEKSVEIVSVPQNESGLPDRKLKTKGTELEENAVKE